MTLLSLLLLGIRNNSDLREYIDDVTKHMNEVAAWREHEAMWLQKAEHSPHMVSVFCADDTQACEFPR